MPYIISIRDKTLICKITCHLTLEKNIFVEEMFPSSKVRNIGVLFLDNNIAVIPKWSRDKNHPRNTTRNRQT